jgi:hypothetical protein
MKLLRADLQLDVVLADGKDDRLTIRNVNPNMSETYVSQIAAVIKDSFEVKGQNIAKIKDLSVIKTSQVPYAITPIV